MTASAKGASLVVLGAVVWIVGAAAIAPAQVPLGSAVPAPAQAPLSCRLRMYV